MLYMKQTQEGSKKLKGRDLRALSSRVVLFCCCFACAALSCATHSRHGAEVTQLAPQKQVTAHKGKKTKWVGQLLDHHENASVSIINSFGTCENQKASSKKWNLSERNEIKMKTRTEKIKQLKQAYPMCGSTAGWRVQNKVGAREMECLLLL